MLGMIKEAQVESGDTIVSPSVEERCKMFGTISILSITINIKADFFFINSILLLYQFLEGNYEIEYYAFSGFQNMSVGLG